MVCTRKLVHLKTVHGDFSFKPKRRWRKDHGMKKLVVAFVYIRWKRKIGTHRLVFSGRSVDNKGVRIRKDDAVGRRVCSHDGRIDGLQVAVDLDDVFVQDFAYPKWCR